MTANNKKFYFLGIGGVGMSAVATLFKEKGYEVSGSDQALYPPSSTLLEAHQIPVELGYDSQHILSRGDSYSYVVGNALSRNNPEVEAVLNQGLDYMSFPEAIKNYLLPGKTPIVVCGTHGKTTTSSWITKSLFSLGKKPHYFIGGVPLAGEQSKPSPQESLYVLEGDEYDTAFFDKGSKFLHYQAQYLVLNNIEFDHADIFKDLEAVYQTFSKLVQKLSSSENLIANIDDKGVYHLLNRLSLTEKVYRVSCLGLTKESDLFLTSSKQTSNLGTKINVREKDFGDFSVELNLAGAHNIANALQALGLLFCLKKRGVLSNTPEEIVQSLEAFTGVQKRLEKLGMYQGALIYRDFAHHPTAVRHILKTMRTLYPGHRLVTGFEPKNASSRRNIFFDQYCEALKEADQVFFLPPAVDKRIKEEERMDIHRLQDKLTKEKAHVFSSKEQVKEWCSKKLGEGDVCLFLSCGDFWGIPLELLS